MLFGYCSWLIRKAHLYTGMEYTASELSSCCAFTPVVVLHDPDMNKTLIDNKARGIHLKTIHCYVYIFPLRKDEIFAY